MNSDQKFQEKFKYLASVQSGKLLLQINDTITYKGEIDSSPYYDILELKAIFERGDVQILSKTTSKLIIKLAILKIDLFSEESLEMQALKAKIEQLEKKLEDEWVEQNLDSKDNFDINYIYRINTGNGYSFLSSAVSAGNIFIFVGASHTIAPSNRRTCSAGWAVTKMQKKKI